MLFLSLFKLLFSISTAIIMGCGILLLFIPIKNNFSFLEKLAYSYGIGLGGITMIMLFLSLFKIPLNFKFIFPIIFIIIAFIVIIKKVSFKKAIEFLKNEKRQDDSIKKERFILILDFILIIFLLCLSLSFLFTAVFIPMQGWDAVAHWGLKSKIFYTNQKITFLDFDIHNEYPNFIPLAETWIYINIGSINDRLVMVLFPLFFISLMILFYFIQRQIGFSKIHALIFTVFLVTGSKFLIFHSYIGYADLPLTFFYSLGTLLFYLWIKNTDKREYLILSSIFIGIGVWTKSEGLIMALINFILFIIYILQNKNKKNIRNLFIYLFIVSIFFIPWYLFCKLNQISIAERYEYQLPDLKIISNVFYYIKEFLLKDIIWVSLMFSTIFSLKKTLSMKKFGYLFYAVCFNLLFIITTHLISPSATANFQISHIMNRLILHITPLAAFLISSQVSEIIKTFSYSGIEEVVLGRTKS